MFQSKLKSLSWVLDDKWYVGWNEFEGYVKGLMKKSWSWMRYASSWSEEVSENMIKEVIEV